MVIRQIKVSCQRTHVTIFGFVFLTLSCVFEYYESLLILYHMSSYRVIAFDEGERILILPWAQAGCQIDLRDFRPGDRLAASTSCATVSDMVTKLCFALVSVSRTLQFLYRIQFLSACRSAYNRQPNQSNDRDSIIMH